MKILKYKKLLVFLILITLALTFTHKNMSAFFITKFNISPYSNESGQSRTRSGIEITTLTENSRLGDCLSIIHTTIYLSQKYNIPFSFYQPFKNSNTLIIDKEKKHRDKIYDNQFKNIVRIYNENEINLNTNNTLYVVGHNFIKTDPTNEQLQNANQELKKLIRPINKEIKPLKSQINTINVALHVRKGGGFDYKALSKDGLDKTKLKIEKGFPIDAQERAEYYSHGLPWLYFRFFLKYTDLIYPLKLPPDSFYVEQIKKISEIYKDKKLNIQIFTDDPNPKNLAEKYSKCLSNENIKFKYRKSGNKHNKNELDDLLFMAQFDCLIRPSSAFSLNAQRLGNFKLVISPHKGTWLAHDILKIEPEIYYKNITQNYLSKKYILANSPPNGEISTIK